MTTSTSASTVTYRKTKTGEWVAYGPPALVAAGCQAVITRRDGTTRMEIVERVGRVFQVEGRDMVYGYLAARPARTSSAGTGGLCDECGQPRRDLRPCTDSSGLSGRCCPACASMAPYERSFA